MSRFGSVVVAFIVGVIAFMTGVFIGANDTLALMVAALVAIAAYGFSRFM